LDKPSIRKFSAPERQSRICFDEEMKMTGACSRPWATKMEFDPFQHETFYLKALYKAVQPDYGSHSFWRRADATAGVAIVAAA